MKRALDTLRAFFLSPEVVGFLLPLAGYLYAPAFVDVLVKPMKESIAFGLAAAALPLSMLRFNYKETLALLSPAGARKVLLEWPDYPMLKTRVVVALLWSVAGLMATLVGVWLVAIDWRPRLAVAILVGGIFSACAATATIVLARFRLRELLGE